MISVLLIVTMVTAFSRAAAMEESGQDLLEMRQVAQIAVEKNRPLTVLLKAKRDNSKKFTGMPSNIFDNGFTLTNTKSGQQSRFDFDEVLRVSYSSTVSSTIGLTVSIRTPRRKCC